MVTKADAPRYERIPAGASAPAPAAEDNAWQPNASGIVPASYDPRQSLAPLVKKVGPAVVNVRTSRAASAQGSDFDLRMFPFSPQAPGGGVVPAPEGVGSVD